MYLFTANCRNLQSWCFYYYYY